MPDAATPSSASTCPDQLRVAASRASLLAQPALRLTSVVELDTGLRPWHCDPADGRVVPWNLRAC